MVILFSCSTEKDKRLNKFYHNTTAYYNGYFNAREIIKVTHKDYVRNTEEDFSKIIPVNRYPNEEESKAFFPEMNRAIDKTSTVIGKHAMPNEKKGRDARKEYGKWMDENWLLMGVSYFYKREYDEAIEKFEYIIKMYPKDKSKYYAKLWLAKTYNEMGDFASALSYLNEIEVEKEAKELKDAKKEKTKKRRKKYSKRKKKKTRRKSKIKKSKEREEKKEEKSFLVEFPKKMSADYYATKADYHLRIEEYKDAIQFLDSAINYEKSKKLRIRYKFIQAQLNQEMGNTQLASDLYSYVIKKSNSYQMVFYSKINRALSASNKNRASLKKELLDLAKDEKYLEFRDQIYYAIAEIELQEFNKEEGIKNLELSASFPPSNEKQKAKTFNRLADVYFEDKEYVPAQKYYDSTLSELDRESTLFAIIKERNESLTRLVGYMNTIKLQDSLLAIGKLSEKQRRDKAEEILYAEKLRKQEEQREKLNQSNDPVSSAPSLPGNNIEKGSFWIYNEKTKERGIKTFTSVWGKISLEDDWRRSSKNQTGGEEVIDLTSAPIVKDEEIDEFLNNVPVTDEQRKESMISIINANYLSGLIYVNILDNSKEAIKSFKDNKSRFHPNSKITPSLYQLYILYQELNKRDDEIAVKNFILENYPKSKEAKIILDPDYANKQSKGADKFQDSYMEAYNFVMNGESQKGIVKIDEILKAKDPNPFECKLLYLKARAYSDLNNEEELENSLQAVVDNCSGTEVGELAETALGKLRNKINKREDNKEVIYVKDEKSVHYFAVVVPLSADIRKLKIALSNFNSTSFDEKGLKTTAIGLDGKTQTILVKQFDNKEDARSYMVAYKVHPTMKEFVTKYTYFTITPANYSTLFKSKELKKYEDFFNVNYY